MSLARHSLQLQQEAQAAQVVAPQAVAAVAAGRGGSGGSGGLQGQRLNPGPCCLHASNITLVCHLFNTLLVNEPTNELNTLTTCKPLLVNEPTSELNTLTM